MIYIDKKKISIMQDKLNDSYVLNYTSGNARYFLHHNYPCTSLSLFIDHFHFLSI